MSIASGANAKILHEEASVLDDVQTHGHFMGCTIEFMGRAVRHDFNQQFVCNGMADALLLGVGR